MNKFILLVFTFIYLAINVVGQDFSASETDIFDIDYQGNIYLVNSSELQKLSSDYKLQHTYSNLMLGEISYLEVDRSTNLFLYFRDFNKIVFLDNTLSMKGSPIDIMDLGFSEANYACSSYNNSFWIYDPINQELIRFNQALEITDRTGNIENITNFIMFPQRIFERNNEVYLLDKSQGIFVFDRYGGYLRRLPFTNIQDIYINKLEFNILKNDSLYIFNPNTLNVDTVVLPQNNVKQIRIINSKIYQLNNNNKFKIEELINMK